MDTSTRTPTTDCGERIVDLTHSARALTSIEITATNGVDKERHDNRALKRSLDLDRSQNPKPKPCRISLQHQPETSRLRFHFTAMDNMYELNNYYATHQHNVSFQILYPWGYDRKVPPDHEELDRVGKEAAEAMRKVSGSEFTVGPAGSSLYPAAGGSDDWAKGTLKLKYSYTVELRDTGRNGFMLPANQIIASGKETLAFMKVIAKAVAKA